jgi:tetratricopeptide (TPR) repeat protein
MSWRIRIGLYVGLIVLYLAYYRFFSTNPGAPGSDRFGILAIALLGTGAILTFVVLRARKGLRLNNEGVALMGQGRIVAALDKFKAAQPLLKRNPLIPFNIGAAQLSMWRLPDAVLDYERANKSALAGNLRQLIAPQLALANALQGNGAASEKWLGESKKLANEAAPAAVLAQAVTACRAGRFDDARALLDRHELRSLGGMQRGLSDALRAWCAEQVAGERRHVDRVAVFGETGGDALRLAWPELAEFLERAPAA